MLLQFQGAGIVHAEVKNRDIISVISNTCALSAVKKASYNYDKHAMEISAHLFIVILFLSSTLSLLSCFIHPEQTEAV